MPNIIVSRNTIKLGLSASSVSDFYKGYTLVLSRFNTSSGRETVQSKVILAYDGLSKIATIDGIWDAGFEPVNTDTYKIAPTYPDNRVSINTAIQTLDYMTSERYGKRLNPYKDLDLPSWLESARACDAQSDITVKFQSNTGVVVGAVYNYTNGGFHWQGKVLYTKGSQHVRFTEVLGKLTNKWNSWKIFPNGAIVYNKNIVYVSTVTAIRPTEPTHTSGEVSNLIVIGSIGVNKVSGAGPAVLLLSTNVGNPVQDTNAAGNIISGYSLYDSDGIDYWRYVGWDEHAQRYVTRHQSNLTIDTSIPIFDNINNLLEHFGGILRYANGKYSLDVEQGEGVILDSAPNNISEDHIIGKIRITDEGIRSSFNSLTVAYPDPANKFQAKNISFFNSNYLKADRNVPKKGNLSIPGITNYYNARLLADKFLIKSRFGLSISLNMSPRGAVLVSGAVIEISHTKYGWDKKRFRIENITHNTDATIDIVAKEDDNDFYIIKNVSRPPSVALAGESTLSTNRNPTFLTATNISSQNETIGGIEVRWSTPGVQDSTIETELYTSYVSKLFISAASITSNSVLNFPSPHNLTVGFKLIAKASLNGLVVDTAYYVKQVVDSTKVTLSLTPAGNVITTLVNATNLVDVSFITGEVVATLPGTMNSYIDIISNPVVDPTTVPNPLLTQAQLIELDRVRKWYWIRNKITTI